MSTFGQSKWRYEKDKILHEYEAALRDLTDAIAEEGFYTAPKHLHLQLRELERSTKFKLLDLNLRIAEEEYNEQLKDDRSTYNSLFAEQSRAWELRKAGLVSALMQEFADLDKAVAFEEEDARRLLLEKELQMLLLITAKAEIEYEKELLEQELLMLDRLTHAKEIELAGAKLLVAQRKLDLIPKLQVLVTKEQALLVEETKVYDEMQNMLPIRQELLAKTEELAGFLARKADARMRLAASLLEQLATKLQLVAEDLVRVGLQEDRVDSEARLAAVRNDVQEIGNTVDSMQDAVTIAGLQNRNAILQQHVTELTQLAVSREAYYRLAEDQVVSLESLRTSTGNSITTSNADNAMSTNAYTVADDSWSTLVNAQQDVIATERIADIQAKAEITSKLVHVLGG